MMVLMMTCSILSILISLPALVISLYTLLELKAFNKSTHKIEYMPVPVPDVSPSKNKEFLEGFSGDESDQFII